MQILKKFFQKLIVMVLVVSILLLFAELSPNLGQLSGQPQRGPQRSWLYPGNIAMAAENADALYYGDSAATAILGNLNYTDVSRNVWSRDAIYEAGALGIVKGNNEANRLFGRTVPLTKEEALAIAYRAAGREAEAQQLGVALNNGRTADNKKTDPLEVWYDGFLQLAANEGLISARDLANALNADQGSLGEDSFRRKSSAQRQEIAYWLARSLKMEPAAQQQELMNYSDWRSVDPEKLPYIEVLLQQKIMTGNGGRINPRQSVTREQAAQIVKNAENTILGALAYLKNTGIVGDVTLTKDHTGANVVSGRNVPITNADGSTALILTTERGNTAQGGRNETVGTPTVDSGKELVVNRNGILGNSGLLQKGDRIHYITDSSNTVKYVYVISNVNDVRYLAVQVEDVDRDNLIVSVVQLFEMNYPDIESISGDQSFNWSKNEMTDYRISPDAIVTINGVRADLSSVSDDATAILTIDSNHLVREVQCVDFGINTEARRIVKGIVEENNPDLGYLTLFDEDGSGTGSTAVLRTYNYVDLNRTEIYRNHKLVSADIIQAGDTAYIRLDSEGDIASISAVDNYITRYASVISKLPTEILVEFEDGTQQLLSTPANIIVIRDRQVVGLKALQDGDGVRLLLNETGKATDLKEITIEGDEHYISNIYKGTITNIDNMSDKIMIMGLQVFDKGNWERTERKGLTAIPLAERFKIYSGGTVLDIDAANRLLYSNEAYIAVEKTYGGEERAVVLSYRSSLDTVVPTISDTISAVTSGAGNFTLARDNKKVSYSEGSIIVKYGRLATGGSLHNNDKAYLALDRNYSTGEYHASVVKVDETHIAGAQTIYRGRISAINEGKNFTVESFSQMQGTDWYYSNTPKTFNITFDTRVLIDEGVLNVRDFKSYGDESYLNRTVYVVADGPNAVLVSTASYGIENIKGTVYSVKEDEILLTKVQAYDASSYIWRASKDTTINILKNTVIIQNGKVTNSSSIKKGASLRVVKKDKSPVGDGYIIFVE